jgi:hypothetical protein
MTLGVHQVDGRIAANAAVKIRAALKQSIDAKKVITEYLHTHPTVSEFISQDRARARAWAMHNVDLDFVALEAALRQHYAEMYVTGVASTYEAWGKILRTRKAQKQPPHNWNPSQFAKDALQGVVNWNTWKPGNAATEALVRPSGGLEKLLNGIKIKSLDMKKSSYDLLGTKLADGFAIGASPDQLANMIEDSLSTPERALTIALTEGSRAANAATNDAYQALGVEQIEWAAADPCDECDPTGDVDGEVVDVGAEFSNGYTQDDLPIHPNCRCSTSPAQVDWANFDYAASLDEALNADN